MKPYLEVVAVQPKTKERKTPLLFVHGMWHGAWCWQEHFLPYFAENNYPSYAINLRGHGKSEGRKRLRWTSLADYVADVVAVVKQIGTPPILIGHSMGGMIVQKYLETHQVPAAILLASAPPHGVFPATLRIARRHPLSFLKANLTLSMYPAIETPEYCKELLFYSPISEKQLVRYHSMMQDESFRAYMDILFFDLPETQKIETPMFVLGAENDPIVSVKEYLETAKAYDAEVHVFPEMSHNMMLETNWKNVADKMLEWLKDQGL